MRALFLVVAYWLSGAAAAAPWIANVDPQGLPALSRGGGPALTSGFGFWGANWAWAEQETKLRIERPLDYSLSGKNPALGSSSRRASGGSPSASWRGNSTSTRRRRSPA